MENIELAIQRAALAGKHRCGAQNYRHDYRAYAAMMGAAAKWSAGSREALTALVGEVDGEGEAVERLPRGDLGTAPSGRTHGTGERSVTRWD